MFIISILLTKIYILTNASQNFKQLFSFPKLSLLFTSKKISVSGSIVLEPEADNNVQRMVVHIYSSTSLFLREPSTFSMYK